MKTTLLALLLTASVTVRAEPIAVGAPLPALAIEKPGELTLQGDDIRFAPWDSSQLSGRVHVLQYLAGRMAASKLNEPLTDRLDAEDFPTDQHRVTTIINLDDALWGTGGFVMGELKSNKRRYPEAGIIADGSGLGLRTWQLEANSSAIAVLDADGMVRFYRQGALSSAEIEQVVALIRQEIARQSTLAHDH